MTNNIRTGNFEQQPNAVFPIQAGEHYVFNGKQVHISPNGAGSLEGVVEGAEIKKADSTMWVDSRGFGYISIPSGYEKGKFQTQKQSRI